MNGPSIDNYINIKSGKYFLIEAMLKFVAGVLIGIRSILKIIKVSMGSRGIPYVKIPY